MSNKYIDFETLKYLKLSGRDDQTISLVEKYCKEQGLWANNNITFTDVVELDVSSVVTSISGPKRPQDKVLLTNSATNFAKVMKKIQKERNKLLQMSKEQILK